MAGSGGGELEVRGPELLLRYAREDDAAALFALAAHLFQFPLDRIDARTQQAAVGFQLGFARSAQADTPPDARKVSPHTGQPG